ncbi:menaquinone biosynthetic enzyme MqnA/MqnD family protein [Glycomyces harbinensis]|uniref:Chorismate dehydratase n=1 Tax=Glycomyces harbinensis TaxID=58114 RepID=A0A1G7CJL7_9ACTN|nr:menaquinone biosynthesis protein [Glycomyces harbinensis]SDE39594.1 chorismate dehydratase [Glycomyces harbinensis]
MNIARRPRVGHIAFLNCMPIYWGLARTGALLELDLHRAAPDELSRLLVDGDLDIGPITLVEYLRHADDLVLIPDPAVAADGPVLSVNLVSRVPLVELPAAPRVALASHSRTGVLLGRMLLEDRYGRKPSYTVTSPDLASALEGSFDGRGADAAVLIGDEALRVHHDPQGHHVLDLAAEWRDWTGLPMVFAVWAVRRDYAEASPGIVKDVHLAFTESVRRSREEIDEVVASAARWEPFEPAALAEYFDRLQFGLSERHLAGLREFASRAARYTGMGPDPASRIAALPEGGPEFFAAGPGARIRTPRTPAKKGNPLWPSS